MRLTHKYFITYYILNILPFSEYNRKQNKQDLNSAFDRIADAFCARNVQAPITLPDPPQNDDVDAIVSVVERRLRKLPSNMLDDAAQKIFQLTYDLVKKTEY